MYEYSSHRGGFAADVGRYVWGVKQRVDHLAADQGRLEHYLAPYVKAAQAQQLRQGQYDRAQRYTEARRDLYRAFEERLTTSPAAKRHLMKGLVADMVRGALTMRDQARTAQARDLANAEVARLTRLERTL
jgi:hypothetical protein